MCVYIYIYVCMYVCMYICQSMCYKLCKCPWHHLIMKTTILVEECTFQFVGFHRGIFLKLHITNSLRMRNFLCKFGWDWSVIKNTLLVERSSSFVCNLPFRRRDFPKAPILAFSAHALQTFLVWLRLVACGRHFTCSTKYSFWGISGSIWRLFLNLHTSHCPRTCYIQSRLVMGQISKGLYLENNDFCVLYQLPYDKFFWNFTHHTFCPCSARDVRFVVIHQ